MASVDNPSTPATQVFSGHLGHLSPAQEDALSAFKANLAEAKLYTFPSDLGKASHDESTLLRFLRARGFDPSAAQKQFSNAEHWRKHHGVDNLYPSFDVDEFESSKRFYPRWTGRRDKNGLPLYVYRIASLHHIQKELDSVPPERRYQRIVVLYELMLRFAFPLCSHLPHPSPTTPVSSAVSIIDLKDVSFGSIWSLRNHLQEASRLATDNYPETLGTIAIVNSPAFFPTVWGWVKGWFDEGTRKKIHILGKDPGPRLRELVNVQDLPRVYGGELQWVFEDEPILDEDAKAVIKETLRGPVMFAEGEVKNPLNLRN